MATQTNKSGTQLIIKKSVLEELILSSARLQNAIASVIEGAVSQPMSASAIKMQRAEEAEVMEGEVLVEAEVETDAEIKKNTENAKKASEGRARTAVAKREKEAKAKASKAKAPKVEEAKVEEAVAEQIKVDEIAAQVEAPVVEAPVVEAPTMTEEEAMGRLRNVGMQLFKQDKELFLKIQSSFNVKALAQLPFEGKLDAIKALEEALK